MAVKKSRFRIKPFTLSFIILSLSLLLFMVSFRPSPFDHYYGDDHQNQNHRRLQNHHTTSVKLRHRAEGIPRWSDVVAQQLKGSSSKITKVGLANMKEEALGQNNELHGLAEIVNVSFDCVDENRRWEDFFPEWIDEEEKWSPPSCPEIPMPQFKDYGGLEVVVARIPCGVRDVFRLQVNLAVANLLVRSGWENNNSDVDRTVYAVFLGSCGPMWEMFRCDDLIWHDDYYWVYKPDLRRLQQKVVMPVGSCQVAPPFADTDFLRKQRVAYVSILHSSESYVCGAIALAQSIIQTKSTKDLILLIDSSISTKSQQGLRAAGWKIKLIQRIRSPHAQRKAYNKWNYSKLRIWQLTDYHKVIFIDSDLIVLKNMDKFFLYPQLSAAGNDKYLFNSGVMLIEPSERTFETLMEKRYAVGSYNGGDQGFLNEMFTWWHRLPSKVNHLKIFETNYNDKELLKHGEIPENVYAIHYLGVKPWMCYRDYDCNWDKLDHQIFASDEAHRAWWNVYKAMPKRLQSYCGLTRRMDSRITKWRARAETANLPDGHWKIKVRDPRRHHY